MGEVLRKLCIARPRRGKSKHSMESIPCWQVLRIHCVLELQILTCSFE